LRRKESRKAIACAFDRGGGRFGFRLAHFSLQTNHIHLIAEAEDRRSLSRGMQGLLVRAAKALNRIWQRRGPVFGDRFHAHALKTPREVRAALVYVLQNARHHGAILPGIDPYSSGFWFDGWKQRLAGVKEDPAFRAVTWLLREGWRKLGLIGIEERPGRARAVT
jgi:hypothetical protein